MSFLGLGTKRDVKKLWEETAKNYNSIMDIERELREVNNKIAGVDSRQDLVRKAARRLNKHGKTKRN